MQTILTITDWVLFALLGFATAYLFIFALASMRRRRDRFPAARIEHRMAVLIPAYREDRVIDQSVEAILAQQYPRERYEAVVIADHCAPATLERLGQLPIRLLEVEFENSSKAKALYYAVAQLAAAGETFDMAVILDADNTVAPDFLSRLNDGYHSGAQAIQAHRRAKNLHTDTALLDAVSEEINNSIFRKGHVALGVSSALIGSGMAFDYNWFCNNITQVSSAGEDKELEVLLLKQGIFIEYLDDVEVLDEKTAGSRAFYNQRRRWLAAQWYSLKAAVRDLPGAVLEGNLDYCDKLVQWMMPPRVLLLGLIPLAALAVTFVDPASSAKWWLLLATLLFALCFAIPDYLVDKPLKRAIRKIPLLMLLMALNLLRLRGTRDKFFHTEHGSTEKA